MQHVGEHRRDEPGEGLPGRRTGVAVGEEEMPATDQGEGERADVGVGGDAAQFALVGQVGRDRGGGLREDRDASAGLPVEAWAPAGRMFDAVIAAQSWHWVDPDAGPVKAARVLRPDGRLAIFGHVFEPPAEVAGPFAAAYRRVAPDSPFSGQPARRPLDVYRAGYATVADKIRETRQFGEPEHWRFDWERAYTRDQWLALLPTTGGLTRLAPDQTATILDAVGVATDAPGGRFTMRYTTLATTAVRTGGS